MKKIISIILVLLLAFSVCGCSPKQKTDMNVYVLTGPTGMGAVNLMEKASLQDGSENYNFKAVAAPDEIVSKISNKEADIAAIPTNLAAKLYSKTNGGVKILAVNTLGVLYVLTNGETTVNSISDLRGKKIYTTGQGSNPEYIVNYILNSNEINPKTDVELVFKAEGNELVSVWATEPNAVIIAPQPVATSINIKYTGSKVALDLTKEWEKINSDSALMMGCIVARTEFLENNQKAVESFLADYEASVQAALADAKTTGALCEKYGIVPNAAIATKALPYANLCYVTGNEMKTKLTGYYNVLLAADATSIGGKLPDEGFWYEK